MTENQLSAVRRSFLTSFKLEDVQKTLEKASLSLLGKIMSPISTRNISESFKRCSRSKDVLD